MQSMRRQLFRFHVVLVLMFSSWPLYAQSLTIKIHTAWTGLGEVRNKITDVLIAGDRGNYRVNNRRVDNQKIDAFLSSLDEPWVESPALDNCGFGEPWLLANYESALEELTHRKIRSFSPRQIE